MSAASPFVFVPSRVEGLNQVLRATIYPDRLELQSDQGTKVIRFAEIAQWPLPHWLWKLLFPLGIRPKWLPVADRDWFHAPADRFFRFNSDPPIVVFMPHDEPRDTYAETCFVRIQQVIAAGGFHTSDLG
jgi:hypothetical protein